MKDFFFALFLFVLIHLAWIKMSGPHVDINPQVKADENYQIKTSLKIRSAPEASKRNVTQSHKKEHKKEKYQEKRVLNYKQIQDLKGNFAPPIYPRISQMRGEEGSVLIGVEVFNGRVNKLKKIKSSGHEKTR